jgi:hypothetical protein
MTSNAHVARRSRLPTRVWSLDDEYAEYSQHPDVAPRFGEYLIERGVLDRRQLLRALQLQDRVPRIRLGESAAVLGYMQLLMVEVLYEQFVKSQGHDRPPRAERGRAKSGRARGWPLSYAPPDCAVRAHSRMCRDVALQAAAISRDIRSARVPA